MLTSPLLFFIPMRNYKDADENPDERVIIDDDGLYITLNQMQYWFNRENGKKLFKTASEEFFKYYNSCRTYNLISEMMVEDSTCAFMYWDNKREAPAFSFPVRGKVTECFMALGLLGWWEL